MHIKSIALSVGFIFAAGALYAASPEMGTWKLNEAKSKFSAGTGKNTTVVYSRTMLGKTKVTVDGTDAKGRPAHNEWTGKFDGKDYSVTGDPNSDTRAYTRTNDRTLHMTLKKNGKVVGTGTITISADGKSRTVSTSGTDAKGKKYKVTAVYDKA